MADVRTVSSNGKRAFASRINKRGHVAARREAASMHLPDHHPGFGPSSPAGLLQGINPALYGAGPSAMSQPCVMDVVEPLDFEEYMTAQQTILDCDPMKQLLEFPVDDILVSQLPPKCPTVSPILPEEGAELDPHVRDCLRTYTSDYTVVTRRYQAHSSAVCVRDHQMERNRVILETPLQEFAVDLESPEDVARLESSTDPDPPSSGRPSTGSVASNASTLVPDSDAADSIDSSFTPRGSWASSIFDLKTTEADPILDHVLDRSVSGEKRDQLNENERSEERHQSIFTLYPMQQDDEMVERRLPADPPSTASEGTTLRIFLQCLQLKLGSAELHGELEPIFASLALYDVHARKKVSENFYFDLNSDNITKMLSNHIPHVSKSSNSKSAILELSSTNSDLCLVLRLEKVLQQGDISEVLKPYTEDDKNREKVRTNAASFCDRLGCYRMPIAWTGIYIMQYITGGGTSSLESESRRGGGDHSFDDQPRTGSLERGLSSSAYNSFRRRAGQAAGTDTASVSSFPTDPFVRGSLDRKSGHSERGGRANSMWGGSSLGQDAGDLNLTQGAFSPSAFEDFQPVKLTVNSFFKQENDRMNDDDLYRALADLKRPNASLKRFKSIPGTFSLEISPAPENYPGSLSPELYPIVVPSPVPETSIPTKCLMEFPAHPVFSLHSHYRNLLYVYPLNLNFANRGGQARNIAIKVQFMAGEDDSFAMPVIFGKSSSPEFLQEAYTSVTWHNRNPDFYDEIKIRLPAKLGDQHHIKFTFYHISCQKKADQPSSVETPIGWTWVPMLTNNRLTTGELHLPVTLEKPPANYHVLSPEVELPGIKWIDNHKPLFKLRINAMSSIHTQDKSLDHFLFLSGCAESARLPRHINDCDMEAEMKKSIVQLTGAGPEPLVHFLPLIFDKLLLLLVRPPCINGQTLMLQTAIFETLGRLVRKLKDLKEIKESTDAHGRCSVITSYLQYRVTLPRVETPPCANETAMTTSTSMTPIATFTGVSTGGGFIRPTSRPSVTSAIGETPSAHLFGRSNSNPDIMPPTSSSSPPADGPTHSSGFDRQGSLRTSHDQVTMTTRKSVHEELVLQWIVASGSSKEMALSQANFFFELMIKSMSCYLHQTNRLNSPQRQGRFPQHFMDDLKSLIENMTREIMYRRHHWDEHKDINSVEQMNHALAFFIYDLFSLVDRGFVFRLISKYCEQISLKISSVTEREMVAFFSLRLDFLRIVCSHEHFVALNLPFLIVSNPSGKDNNSPTPSINSSISNTSSLTSTGTMVEKGLMTELSYDFCQQHFLIGLILSDLDSVLGINNPFLHSKAVNLIRGLLTSHDMDPRYASPECRARVAALYLPLLGIVMDALPQLFDPNADDVNSGSGSNESSSGGGSGSLYRRSSIHEKGTVRIKAMPHLLVGSGGDNFGEPMSGGLVRGQRPHSMDAGTLLSSSTEDALAEVSHSSQLYGEPGVSVSLDPFQLQPRPQPLNQETTRHLMASFLWVTKNNDQNILRVWWSELPISRLNQMLDVLYLCLSNFEYKGSKLIERRSTLAMRRSVDMRHRLELALQGAGSARMELLRRRGAGSGSPGAAAESGNRFDKDMWFQSIDAATEKMRTHVVHDSHIEGNLTTEINLIVLDTLEHVIHVAQVIETHQSLLSAVMRIILHALAINQSTRALTSYFATQRALVSKFPQLLFEEETDQCADLCLRLLAHCASRIAVVRANATASLYLLMRQNFEIGNNFARVKMQVTMSLSSLVGQDQRFSEAFLRRSLKTILSYAESDEELHDSTFPEQVRDMAFNLHMILSDTVKMKEFQEDPEMLLDLMYRIAKGYQTSPDLRLTWLQNMAQKHNERGNHAEAAMCLVHSAALVAEYLNMLEDQPYLPVGCVGFEGVSPNVLEESAISDDVVSPDEEGICTGKFFSTSGMVGLLEAAASHLSQAHMCEVVNEVYKILIPIHEANRDYKKLQHVHNKVAMAFGEIVKNAGKRFFGSYFRVGFYGANFKDLDGEEFVYKEPVFTKLGDISNRLESFYSDRFGADNVVIIKDSRVPEREALDPEKNYIQVTYVEPHFDEYERKDRVTEFEKNYRLRRFVYSTPFTEGGKHHGELGENFIRKTILTVANSFPYVKTRINVVEKESNELTPIEVALEDIQKKISQLVNEINRDPCDTRMLQLVLQGCIGTTVNQGPMEIAMVFLSPVSRGDIPSTMHHTRLRLAFKEFSRRCKEALHKNKQLTGQNQREFHNEMNRNYNKFVERLTPLIAKEGAPLDGTLRRSPRKRHLPAMVHAPLPQVASLPANNQAPTFRQSSLVISEHQDV